MAAVQQYMVPKTPAESQWIDKNKKTATPAEAASPAGPALSAKEKEKAKARGRKRGPPTRRLVRHVLRARAQAVHALAAFFSELEHKSEGKRVHASMHLAKLYGGFSLPSSSPQASVTEEGKDAPTTQGWRDAREVLAFLRARGARITSLESQIAGDYWAASAGILSDAEELSDAEYSSDAGESMRENEDLQWVVPAIQ